MEKSRLWVKSQSEETYMTDVIVSMIRASLKDLPIGKSGYTVFSRPSVRVFGKRSDVMFIASCNNRSYELIFGEKIFSLHTGLELILEGLGIPLTPGSDVA